LEISPIQRISPFSPLRTKYIPIIIIIKRESKKREKKKLKKILEFVNKLLKIWIENPQKAQTLASFKYSFKYS